MFDRYYADVHGYVSRRLGRGLADDLASETFLIAFDRRRRYDVTQPTARPWLFGIASNLVSRHRRAEVRRYRALARAGLPDAIEGDAERIAGRLDTRALRARLAAALVQTPDRDREVLLLVAWAGLSLEPPSHAARHEARTALLSRAAPRADRRRRSALRWAWVGGLALMLAAAVGLAENLGGEGRHGSVLPTVSSASAKVLQGAALAAEKQPVAAPRDDQWIYTEDKLTSSDGGRPATIERWHRVDGRGSAMRGDHGRLYVETMRGHRGGRPRPFDSYKAATALPTDPAALLRWAYAQTPDVTGAGSTDDAEAFNILRGILGNGVLPDHLQASVFRAMERIPGVAVRTVDVLGRPTLAPGQTGEWLRQELLLDPETYAYRGQRSTVVKNATINPLKAGNSTGRVYKGHTVVAERLAARVVDRPGAR